MPATIGTQQIPSVESPCGFPAGDAALGYVGLFLQAAINRSCGSLWDTVCPGRDVVAFVFYRNPTLLFEEERLPALYLWRGRYSQERIADRSYRTTSRIEIAWIAEPGQEDHLVMRNPMMNAIIKAVTEAVSVQRCPGWIATGDTDVHAAVEGSLINAWTGFDTVELSDAMPQTLTFDRVDGDGRPLPYLGFNFSIDVTEHLVMESRGVHPNAAVGTHRTNSDTTTDVVVEYPGEA